MPATEAQIRANKANAALAKGPSSAAGKSRSRANSLKHGMTGEGIVLPAADAVEVERLARTFQAELKPDCEVGEILTQRMAVQAVRMSRSVIQETAALAEKVRQALDEFEAPEGVDAELVEQLRTEAADRALFDTSKEACLARKYEAAAERSFFRALKELRLLKKKPIEAPAAATVLAAEAQASMAKLGSFFPAEPPPRPATPKPVAAAPKTAPTPAKPLAPPTKATLNDWDPFAPAQTHVPIAIGRAR